MIILTHGKQNTYLQYLHFQKLQKIVENKLTYLNKI